jgi:hypothetical protein
MNNWKDYVGYQPLNEEELPRAYYSLVYTTTTNEDGSLNVSTRINTVAIGISEMTLTENEVGKAVEDVLSTFPKREIKNIVELQRAKNEIALTTRHTFPDTNFNDVWYYNGPGSIDSAIYVISYMGHYAVKKHVDFEKYGFIVTSTPTASEQPIKFVPLE